MIRSAFTTAKSWRLRTKFPPHPTSFKGFRVSVTIKRSGLVTGDQET